MYILCIYIYIWDFENTPNALIFFFNFLYERGTEKHVTINFNEGIFFTQTALPLPVKGEKNANTVECPSINSLKPIPFSKGQMRQLMKVLHKGEICFREGDEKTRLIVLMRFSNQSLGIDTPSGTQKKE